ncbi:MAG TPA: hypothetical protein VMF89_08160, partial [Polyangiales bacterium]|nr:hypothetical protein [Polyangiales bacterium]
AITAPLTDGTDLLTAPDGTLEHFRSARGHRFEFASGIRLEGELRRGARLPDGRRLFLELTRATLTLPGRAPLELPRFALVPPSAFVSIEAGAVDASYHPHSQQPNSTVPKPRQLPPEEQRQLTLFERSARAHSGGAASILAEFPAVHAQLHREFSNEWLLRWNLLESLLKLDIGQPLAHQLRSELEELEIRLERRQPIATGLRYLAERTGVITP